MVTIINHWIDLSHFYEWTVVSPVTWGTYIYIYTYADHKQFAEWYAHEKVDSHRGLLVLVQLDS